MKDEMHRPGRHGVAHGLLPVERHERAFAKMLVGQERYRCMFGAGQVHEAELVGVFIIAMGEPVRIPCRVSGRLRHTV